MKRKIKGLIFVSVCVAFILVIGYWIIGNPAVFINNYKLERSVRSVTGEIAALNDIIPFEWDIVYTFDPYESRERMEEIVGFKSADIKENHSNEGMVHLLFVKDRKVMASVLGYDENLGYSIDFTSEVTFAENARFNVTRTDGVTRLKYRK